MKNFEIYKDLRNNPIYKVNDTFYIENDDRTSWSFGDLEPAPNFLQSWYKKWIQENRTDLIIKTNFSDFSIVSTK